MKVLFIVTNHTTVFKEGSKICILIRHQLL